MRTYGNANTSVGAREGIPVPTEPSPWSRREELVRCGCGHRGRRGAFHICIDLTDPVPPPPPPPVPKPKKVDPPATDGGPSRKRRGGTPALNEEQSIEAARLYVEQGLSMLAVANHFGVSQNAVHNALKRLDVPRRAAGGRHAP